MFYGIEVNYLAVFVAAIASMVVGSIVYAGPVLGNKWMELLDKTKEDIQEGAGKAMGMAFLVSLLQAYVLAHMVSVAGAETLTAGAMTGFWLWLGVVATSHLTNMFFEGRNKGVVWIFLLNALLTLLVQGAILAMW